jgi:AcrR family transcriptional regulator
MGSMNERTSKPTGAPRERILTVAADLFYRQGYRATGINEVIRKSGVAKATFYNHFPTKDDLGLAYLRQAMEREVVHVENFIHAANRPLERFLSVMRSVVPWLEETDFRGCPFVNMASEIPDPDDSLRNVGKATYDYVRGRLQTLSEELIASDEAQYGHLDANVLTGEYMVAMAGAIALAEIYHAKWPVENALSNVRRLIGEPEE